MRRLALLACILLLPVASAATLTLRVTATDQGFFVEGERGANPTLHIAPGTRVVLEFKNLAETAQNLRIGSPIDVETPCCQAMRASARLTFDVAPDMSGRVAYWSTADPEGKRGIIEIGTVPPRVEFLAPLDGVTVTSSVVSARVQATGVEKAWFVYAMDGVNLSEVTTQPDFLYRNVTDGHHLLHVELVDAAGAQFLPRVFSEVIVYRGREALPSGPTADGTQPTDGSSGRGTPAVGLLVTLTLLGAVALTASRSRRPR